MYTSRPAPRSIMAGSSIEFLLHFMVTASGQDLMFKGRRFRE